MTRRIAIPAILVAAVGLCALFLWRFARHTPPEAAPGSLAVADRSVHLWRAPAPESPWRRQDTFVLEDGRIHRAGSPGDPAGRHYRMSEGYIVWPHPSGDLPFLVFDASEGYWGAVPMEPASPQSRDAARLIGKSRKRAGTVRGTVVDVEGRAIAGAQVRVDRAPRGPNVEESGGAFRIFEEFSPAGPSTAPSPTPIPYGSVLHPEETNDLFLSAARTDSEGRFTVSLLPVGEAVVVRARADGYRPSPGLRTQPIDPEQPPDLRLPLRRGAVLEGRITGPEGRPVAAARAMAVRVESASAARSPEIMPVVPEQVVTTSGEDGSYRLASLSPGYWELLVESTGMASAFTPVVVPVSACADDAEPLVQDLALASARPLQAVLLPAGKENRQCLDQALVQIVARPIGPHGEPARMASVRRTARADREGRFEVADLGTSVSLGLRIQVGPAAWDYQRLSPDDVRTVAGNPLEIQLPETATLRGALLDADLSFPPRRTLRVRVLPAAGNRPSRRFESEGFGSERGSSGRSDSDVFILDTDHGCGFELDGLLPGMRCEVDPGEVGFLPRVLTIEPGGNIVVLRLGSRRTVRGIVRDAATGEPVSGMVASFRFRPFENPTIAQTCAGQTDGEGRFEFAVRGDGVLESVFRECNGLYVDPMEEPLVVKDRDPDPVELTARKAVPLTVRVTDPATGRPIGNAAVQVREVLRPSCEVAWRRLLPAVATEGRHTVGLPLDVPFEISAHAPFHFPIGESPPPSRGERCSSMTLTASAVEAQEPVDLALHSGGVLTGVVFSDGKPAAGLRVEAREVVEMGGHYAETVTGAEGEFRFAGLPPGSEHAWAVMVGGDGEIPFARVMAPPLSGEPPASSARLETPAAGGVVGRAAYPDGSAAAWQRIRVNGPVGGDASATVYETMSDAEGRFRIGGLPAGVYGLSGGMARSAGRVPTARQEPAATVRVAAGEDHVLDEGLVVAGRHERRRAADGREEAPRRTAAQATASVESGVDRLNGRVVTPSGAPLSDWCVSLVVRGAAPRGDESVEGPPSPLDMEAGTRTLTPSFREVASSECDREGRFELRGSFGEGPWRLFVREPRGGGVKVFLETTISAPLAGDDETDFVAPLSASLSARLIAAGDGGPLESVSVSGEWGATPGDDSLAPRSSGEKSLRLEPRRLSIDDLELALGAEGLFEMEPLPAGVLSLTLEAPGFAPVTRKAIPLTAGETVDLGVLEMQPLMALVGRFVTDRPAGLAQRPLVRIEAASDDLRRIELGEVRPGPEGWFRMEAPRQGHSRVSVDVPGFLPLEIDGSEWESGDVVYLGEVRLTPGLRLGGLVTGAGDRPLGGVAVHAVSHGSPRVVRRTRTDASGVFVLEGFAPGAVRLRIGAGSQATEREVDLGDSEETEIRIRLGLP